LEGWANVEKMNSISQVYVKQHGRESQVLSFLPEEIRKNMNCPEHLVQYHHETGELYSRVFFRRYGLIDCLLGRTSDSLGVLIGHIGSRE
jgi:hypothetical protein